MEPGPPALGAQSWPLDHQGSPFSLYFLFLFFCLHSPSPHSPALSLPIPFSLSLVSPSMVSLPLPSLFPSLSLSPSPSLSPSLHHPFSLSLTALSSLSLHICHHPPVFNLLLFPSVSDSTSWCLPLVKEPDPSSLGLGQRAPALALLPSPLSSPGDQGPQEWELGPRWPQAGHTGRRHGPDLGPSTAAAQAGSSPPAQRGSHSVWTHLPRTGPQRPGPSPGEITSGVNRATGFPKDSSLLVPTWGRQRRKGWAEGAQVSDWRGCRAQDPEGGGSRCRLDEAGVGSGEVGPLYS